MFSRASRCETKETAPVTAFRCSTESIAPLRTKRFPDWSLSQGYESGSLTVRRRDVGPRSSLPRRARQRLRKTPARKQGCGSTNKNQQTTTAPSTAVCVVHRVHCHAAHGSCRGSRKVVGINLFRKQCYAVEQAGPAAAVGVVHGVHRHAAHNMDQDSGFR